MTEDWNENTSYTCDCSNSEFCDPHHGHVVTGDLKIITLGKLRSLLCKGPSFREPMNVNWDKFIEEIKSSLDVCVPSLAKSNNVEEIYGMERCCFLRR